MKRCDAFFSVIQIKSNSISSLEVNDCALVLRLRGGQKHSRLCCEILKKGSEKCLQHRCSGQASRTNTHMIKYLSQSSCGRQASRLYSTVAPPWWQTVEFCSEDNIQQYGAQLPLFSFSFD